MHRRFDRGSSHSPQSEVVKGIHPRDLFDALQTPNLSRVASLPQLARGEYQFYPQPSKIPPLPTVLTTALYVCLKALAIIVYFILPGAALGVTIQRFLEWRPLSVEEWLIRWDQGTRQRAGRRSATTAKHT
jgi:hypothetical protein